MGSEALLRSIPETCARLGVGRTQVYELIARGELEAVQLGRRRLVPDEAIVEFVRRLRAETAGSGAPAA
jgi:excisionase family DNA binding protein